jgi:hypothetical protein
MNDFAKTGQCFQVDIHDESVLYPDLPMLRDEAHSPDGLYLELESPTRFKYEGIGRFTIDDIKRNVALRFTLISKTMTACVLHNIPPWDLTFLENKHRSDERIGFNRFTTFDKI